MCMPCPFSTKIKPKMIFFLFFSAEEPIGIFLEAGFNNIMDAALHHPLSTVS